MLQCLCFYWEAFAMILNHFPCSYCHCTDVDQRQETHNIAWWHTQYFCRERIERASRRNGKRGRLGLWRRWFGRCKFGDDILYLMHDNVVHNIEVMPRIGTRSDILVIMNSHLRSGWVISTLWIYKRMFKLNFYCFNEWKYVVVVSFLILFKTENFR